MPRFLKPVFVTIFPLLFTAAATYATNLAYAAHLFDALEFAKVAAAVTLIGLHVFVPIWAATRARWLSALIGQLALLLGNYLAFWNLALTVPHGAELPTCGTAAAAAMMGSFMLLGLYVPFSALGAWLIRRCIGDPPDGASGLQKGR